MDRLSAIQAFLNVARKGSFAGAAKAMGLSHSVISKRVQDLEAYLQTQLLVRSTRKVTLTQAGEHYMEEASRLVDDMEMLDHTMRDGRSQPRGTLRLSAPLSFGLKYLSPMIAAYLAQEDQVRMNISLSDRRVDLIEDGFDMAIRIGPLADSSLMAKKLKSTRMVLCASPDYLNAHPEPTSLEDLKQHECLTYSHQAGGKSWPLSVNGRNRHIPVSGRLQADNGDLLHEGALSGCGIAFLPHFIVERSLKNKNLKPILEQYPQPDFDIHAVYPGQRNPSPLIRSFIDLLSAKMTA